MREAAFVEQSAMGWGGAYDTTQPGPHMYTQRACARRRTGYTAVRKVFCSSSALYLDCSCTMLALFLCTGEGGNSLDFLGLCSSSVMSSSHLLKSTASWTFPLSYKMADRASPADTVDLGADFWKIQNENWKYRQTTKIRYFQYHFGFQKYISFRGSFSAVSKPKFAGKY